MIPSTTMARIEAMVRGNLSGATLIAAVPYDESTDEARFAVAWRRPVRECQPGDDAGFTYGTHVAAVTEDAQMLVWGHYEIRSVGEALADLIERAPYALANT